MQPFFVPLSHFYFSLSIIFCESPASEGPTAEASRWAVAGAIYDPDNPFFFSFVRSGGGKKKEKGFNNNFVGCGSIKRLSFMGRAEN